MSDLSSFCYKIKNVRGLTKAELEEKTNNALTFDFIYLHVPPDEDDPDGEFKHYVLSMPIITDPDFIELGDDPDGIQEYLIKAWLCKYAINDDFEAKIKSATEEL